MTTNNRFIQTTDYLSIALAMTLSVLGFVKDIFAARLTKASAPAEHLRIAIMVEVTTSSTQCRLMELLSSPSSDSTLV
ncbi:hypothetical protein EDD85DRAFT_951443 [Armillaria nabsnona]|nr:hypothetical protein EDD85DRAFT_951443 [Armillaria nabsnona]